MVLLFQKEGKNIWRSKLFFLVSIYPLSQGRQNYLTEHCFLCRHISFRKKQIYLMEQTLSFYCRQTSFRRKAKLFDGAKSFFFVGDITREAKLFDEAYPFLLLSTYLFQKEGKTI